MWEEKWPAWLSGRCLKSEDSMFDQPSTNRKLGLSHILVLPRISRPMFPDLCTWLGSACLMFGFAKIKFQHSSLNEAFS